MSERAIVSSGAEKRGANERLAFLRREEEPQTHMQTPRSFAGCLLIAPCGDVGAATET